MSWLGTSKCLDSGFSASLQLKGGSAIIHTQLLLYSQHALFCHILALYTTNLVAGCAVSEWNMLLSAFKS